MQRHFFKKEVLVSFRFPCDLSQQKFFINDLTLDKSLVFEIDDEKKWNIVYI